METVEQVKAKLTLLGVNLDDVYEDELNHCYTGQIVYYNNPEWRAPDLTGQADTIEGAWIALLHEVILWKQKRKELGL